MKNEIAIYSNEHLESKVEALISDETLWLSQAQLVMLFESGKANISEHIKHIFQSGELDEVSVVRKFRTTASDGKKWFAFSKMEMPANEIVQKLEKGEHHE